MWLDMVMEREPEQLVVRRDARTGLVGVIALHSTVLGPATGGCRRWQYTDEAAAIDDAKRLAEGMTLKNALAGIPFGGGKSVLLSDGAAEPTPAQLKVFASWLNELGGRYVTAEDVGMGVAQMRTLAEHSPYVSGLGYGGFGGDPSPKTAYGVFLGLKALVQRYLEREHLYGLTVAVQGLGSVGMSLCHWLARAGASLVVADVRRQRVEMAVRKYDARPADVRSILREPVDVLAPCALGGVLTPEVAAALPARLVAGAANNQLSDPAVGEMLAERGVIYAPDFVINAGGVISVAQEYLQQAETPAEVASDSHREDWLSERLDAIPRRLLRIVASSRERGESADVVARREAAKVLAGGRGASGQSAADRAA